MTEAGKILICTLPVACCDVNFLTPLQEYLVHGLETRCLVLPKDAQLEIRDLPPLGAAKVTPVPMPLREKDCGDKLPAPPASFSFHGEAPAEKRAEKPAPLRPAGKGVGRALPMTAGEIASSYRQAAKPLEQVKILAELNACSEELIRKTLATEGIDVPQKKRGRPKAEPEAAHE